MKSTNTNIKKLNWEDIDAYVNEPVYHKDEKYDGYRIVAGYKRYNNERYIMFTDGKSEIPFDRITLYSSRPVATEDSQDNHTTLKTCPW